MVQSKLTLLALASTALAGVVRREEPEVDHLTQEDHSFDPLPDWVNPTLHFFEETRPSPTAFVQAFSDHSREPHSTYLPTILPSHFPLPTKEALPPFITSFPGAGEFAHTKDSTKPSIVPSISHPAPPGAAYDGPPPSFSEPVRPEEPQHKTPPAFQASSSHPPFPSSHAETPYASPTKPPSFTDGQSIPSILASVKPTEPWDGLDSVKPTDLSWISHLLPPSKSTPRPEGLEKDHNTEPSTFPGAYQGPPPLPFGSIPDEASKPHDSSPAVPHKTPTPDESEHEPHPPPFASGKPAGPDTSSPATAHQTPPPHGSYQEPPPFDFGPGGPSVTSSSPPHHQITPPPESHQGPPPGFTIPKEPSQPKSSPPAAPQKLPPPPTEPYHESSPPPSVSTPGEPPEHKSSSPESYQLPPPSSPPLSHPGDSDHPAGPAIPDKGPSPHYGAVPPVSCPYSAPGEAPVDTHAPHPMGHDEQYPHPGEANQPPFTPPVENGKEPHDHDLAPPHVVPTSEKPSVTHTNAYVPHFSKPEPTITEAPSVSHADIPPAMPSNCTESHSRPAVPTPVGGKSQPQGTTGEHHTYGPPSNAHPTEVTGVTGHPFTTKAAPEPSKTGVPKVGESAVHYSSFASASPVPITALLGVFGTFIFFFLQ